MSKADAIHYTIQMEVAPGKLGEFEALADKAIAQVKADEPDCLVYRWDINGQSVTLHERFVDEAALMKHASSTVATEIFPALLGMSEVANFSAHGALSAEATAVIVGGFGATLYEPWKGFAR